VGSNRVNNIYYELYSIIILNMNFSLITLATSLVAIASSKSITLELYKSHAKTKTGKVLPLD